jgi:hypothetical protein
MITTTFTVQNNEAIFLQNILFYQHNSVITYIIRNIMTWYALDDMLMMSVLQTTGSVSGILHIYLMLELHIISYATFLEVIVTSDMSI